MSDFASPPIGVLVFPDAEEMDFVGPWELFGLWHEHAGGPPCVLLAESTTPVRCRKGLRVVPDRGLNEAPTLHTLVVPGGEGSKQVCQQPEALAFVRSAAADASQVLSVCTGARILQAAGLLDGRSATTHWAALPEARRWPSVTVEERRFVRDGPIWTAAGVSAGIDAALALIEECAGTSAARNVRRQAEYFPNAPSHGARSWPDAPGYIRGEP
jgi:transcriptional regulator GlxA family with amidase domain